MPFEPVTVPFTLPALRQVLAQGASPAAPYTHQQICDWAQRFALAVREARYINYGPFAAKDEHARAAEVAEDVGGQWDLFLSNTYTLSQLQSLDFASVTLPREWFEEWLQRLSQATV